MNDIIEAAPINIERLEQEIPDPITQFPPDMQRAIHMYLSGSYRIKEIAGIINRAPATVGHWLKSAAAQAYINTVQSEEDLIIKQGLKALRLKALYKMSDLLESEDDNVARQVATQLLNAELPQSIKNINITHKTFEEQLKDLDATVIIDADYKDI